MEDLELINSSIAHLALYGADPREQSIKHIATATGFIWQYDGLYYLGTNWHVFSGRNHDTGEFMPQGVEPQFVQVSVPGRESIVLPLLENRKKKWLEHSGINRKMKNVPKVDIALLPLEQTFFPAFNDILGSSKAKNDVRLEVTTPLSIIGYPELKNEIILGSDKEEPCWVNGNVAKPPRASSSTFLVNSFPYGGMSGSPVLWVYSNRPIKLVNGATMTNAVSGEFVQFAGIFSGRMYEKMQDTSTIAPLARVWLPDLINEILA